MNRYLLALALCLLPLAANAQTSKTFWHFDHHTETAATAITELIPPRENYRATLVALTYTPAATAHDLVLMKAIAKVSLTAASAASDTTLDLSSATFGGDTLASGDYVVLEHGDGTHGLYLGSGLATLVLTVNAISKAANSGADVWIMGAVTDSTYHQTIKSIASTRTTHYNGEAGLITTGYDIGTYSRDGYGDPLVIHSANGTNAGTLNHGAARYER